MYNLQMQTPKGTYSVTFDHYPTEHELMQAVLRLQHRPELCALVLPPYKKEQD